MPISSTNQRLTRELYKPPPRSLIELRLMQQQGKYHSSGSIGLRTSVEGGLSRERHLDGMYSRKTAVVEPINDKETANKDGWENGTGNGESTIKTSQKNTSKIATSASTANNVGYCRLWCCGAHLTRCNIISFFIGLLLGALLTGLVVGLTLYGEIKARDERIAELEALNEYCFQDPCPSRSSSCGYSTNNEQIVCFCDNTTSQETISEAGYIDGYNCTFFNRTMNPTTPSIA
uniref:uncharacterized protein LOC120328884 n=1 Tax=Styela clava TaxID=7725 RepID=UPI00193996B0|nr:uncharacterized protein LOC120328884 [Styela clava]